jgi:hypothetical protein
MIGRRSKPTHEREETAQSPRGFDDFEMKLGDMMRGERATMGKSLLDVQRELRIKANYIAAIENCDPDAFETQGFIAGYVRSYARYLDLDPDATFAQFCQESGFQTAHGMDSAAGHARKEPRVAAPLQGERDPFRDPALPFSPADDGFFARLEPGAIGSVTVLVALIAALGYGGWSVLQEIQRVQVSPVDQTPLVLSELDPLDGAMASADASDGTDPAAAATGPQTARSGAPSGAGVFAPPSAEGLDRLYRPQALDVPVLIARDAPISSLDPSQFGSFAERTPSIAPDSAAADRARLATATGPDALPRDILTGDGLHVVAARPSWVRIRDGADEVLYTGILNAGETWAVPADATDPTIEVGESSAIYYVAGGRSFGPTGPRGAVTEDFALEPAVIAAILPEADLRADADFAEVLAGLGKPVDAPLPTPRVVETVSDSVTIVATREAWVRVRAASGTVLYETVMQPGDFYTVPQTEGEPTIRTGNAGAIYFAASGQTFGPYGANGEVADNLALSVDTITATFAAVDIEQNTPLARAVAGLNAAQVTGAD